MPYMSDTVTDEDMTQAATEAFVRPRPSSMWDERLYTSHAPVMSWAERGDDFLAESNYRAALELLTVAAGDDADDHVIDATISDWLVGSLRQIFVQARDESGAFTPVWREAVRIAYALKDYPVLDESDLSERESAEFDRQLEDALWQARNAFDTARYREDEDAPDIDDETHERVTQGVYETLSDGAEFHGGDSYADCDYQAVADEYAQIANTILGNNPDRPLVSLTRTVHRGQGRLL